MSINDVFLTREGYENLIKQLAELKEKRKIISLAIGEAREEGDLRENAGYESAKNAQAMNEKKISEIEMTLCKARLIENENIPAGEVYIGAKVKLKDVATKDEIDYTLVSEAESDIDQGKISVSSPVGKALLGHKKDETIEIRLPARTIKYQIVEISR